MRSQAEAEWLGQPGDQQHGDRFHPQAVYCCIKEYMGSRDLKQAPVLVLPAGRSLVTPMPTHVVPRIPLAAATISNYTKLACKCQDFNLPNAAKALADLMFEFSYYVPPLTWLSEEDVPYRWVSGEAAEASQGGELVLPTPSSILLQHDCL